jgi:hypothetical protein
MASLAREAHGGFQSAHSPVTLSARTLFCFVSFEAFVVPSFPMHSRIHWFTAVLLTALLSGACKPAPGQRATAPALSPEVETAALERGKAIAGQAFALLSTNLARALGAGGITNALSYCSERAYPLTALVAETNQVRLQRFTHRPRNPGNEVSSAELGILREFQLALGRGEKPSPVVRAGANDAVVFYSPIMLANPLCLQCHGAVGTDIQPATAALLATLYPRDQATGFKLGDLRGLWRIEMPARGRAEP